VRPARDPLLDLIRVACLATVVIWHWAFTTIDLGAGGPHAGNPIGVTPWLWLLTWVAQPMPLFFVVGGVLHGRSLARRAAEGSGAVPGGPFVSGRIRRLLPPVLPVLVPVAALLAVAVAADWTSVSRTLVLLVSPLWFLAVYVSLIALAPATYAAHRRSPVLALVVGVAAVAGLDVARFAWGWSSPLLVVAGFVAVWAWVHQLGYLFDRLRVAPVWARGALAVGGLAGLAVLVTVGPYPASMVGVPGEATSNMAPPTAAVLCLALFQLGLVLLLAEPLTRFAARRTATLEVAGRWSMTVYVWHLVAWAGFLGILLALGVEATGQPSTGWWLMRPIWLVGPALVAIPLCAATARFDRSLVRAR
jgi:peptidoglycan/LPS O-acetylase OafA/YrhL